MFSTNSNLSKTLRRFGGFATQRDRFGRASRKARSSSSRARKFSFLKIQKNKIIFHFSIDKTKKRDIILSVLNIGASPSGKATDSDSVITGVRIPVPQPKNSTSFDLSNFFIQAAGLVYHHRAKRGAYHQPQRGCISSRFSVYLACGLMICNASH